MSKVLDKVILNTINSEPGSLDVAVNANVLGKHGTKSVPMYSFQNQPDTGIYQYPCLDDWTTQTIPSGWSVVDFAWSPELTLFIAVATGGERVMSSPDGETWTARVTQTGFQGTSCAWAPELTRFVVIPEFDEQGLYSDNGIDYTTMTTTLTGDTEDVVWSPDLGLFVVVTSDVATVWTSVDGDTWETQVAKESWGVTWSPELTLFVAVDDTAPTVQTSQTGTSWTTLDAPIASWRSVTWSPELSLFVAVGLDGATMTSSLGTSAWTLQTSINTTTDWQSIIWVPETGQFVAVGLDSPYIMSSENGIDWISRYSPEFPLAGVGWSAELNHYVIGGLNGTEGVALSKQSVGMTSQGTTVLTTCSSRSTLPGDLDVNGNFSTEEIRATTATNELLFTETDGFVVDIAGSPAEFTISDTVIISNVDLQGVSGTFSSPSFSFINNSSSGIYQAVCIDDWVTQTHPSSWSWSDIIWAPELTLFIACAGGGRRLATSPDGVTWTNRQNSAGFVGTAVGWAPEISIAVHIPFQGNIPFYSTNGIDWILASTSLTFDNRAVTWSPSLGLFATVCSDGHPTQVQTSPDGDVWTFQTTPQNSAWNDIVWSEDIGVFVAVSRLTGAQRVMTSTDGTSWVTQTSPVRGWKCVGWSPELSLFAAAGELGVIMTSPDGETWTERTGPTTITTWEGMEWSPETNQFVSVGSSGPPYIMSSSDGITWISRNSPAIDWQNVAWSAQLNQFCTAGDNGTEGIALSTQGVGFAIEGQDRIHVCLGETNIKSSVAVSNDLTVGSTKSPTSDAEAVLFTFDGSSRYHQIQNDLTSATPNTWTWTVTVATDDPSLSRTSYFEFNMNGCQNDGSNSGTRRYAGTLRKVLDTSTTWNLLTLEDVTIGDPPTVSIDVVTSFTNTFEVTFTAPASITTNGYNMSVELKLSGSVYITGVSTTTA